MRLLSLTDISDLFGNCLWDVNAKNNSYELLFFEVIRRAPLAILVLDNDNSDDDADHHHRGDPNNPTSHVCISFRFAELRARNLLDAIITPGCFGFVRELLIRY